MSGLPAGLQPLIWGKQRRVGKRGFLMQTAPRAFVRLVTPQNEACCVGRGTSEHAVVAGAELCADLVDALVDEALELFYRNLGVIE